MSSKEFIPIHDPKILEQMKHKQCSIDALQALTKAIFSNASTLELFQLYISTLRKRFNYTNIFFLYKTATGWFVIENDQHNHFTDLDLLQFLSPFKMITYLDEDEAVMGEYDTIVPVLSKGNPMAYVMIKGVYNKVIDSVEEEMRFLEAYTNVTVMAAENKRLVQQETKREHEQKQLKMAADVQQALVPNEFPKFEGCDFHSVYLPHQEIGGDGFDVIPHNQDNGFYISIADVSGKGVAAALLMANFQATLRAAIYLEANINEFAKKLNEQVYQITNGESFVSMFVAYVNLDTKTIQYINFGHNPPLLVDGSTIIELDKGSTILGVFQELPFLDMGQVKYEDKITLFCYTDGLIDVLNDHDIRLNAEDLKQFLISKEFDSAKEINDYLLQRIEQYKGSQSFTDDITILTTLIQ